MRTDRTIAFNTVTAEYGDRLAKRIGELEDELSGLKRLHGAVVMAAENGPDLPSFVTADDPGFKAVGEAAAQTERRNVRPVVPAHPTEAA